MMFTIYDQTTGVITNILQAPDVETVQLNLPPGGAYLVEGAYDPETHYISNGIAQPYPPRPSSNHQWTGSEWVDPRSQAEKDQALDAIRGGASLTKLAFCMRCMEVGLLTPAEAIAAAKGEIPASFQPMVEAMTPMERDFAAIHWAGATRVDRLDPFILNIATQANISPQMLDQIFEVN